MMADKQQKAFPGKERIRIFSAQGSDNPLHFIPRLIYTELCLRQEPMSIRELAKRLKMTRETISLYLTSLPEGKKRTNDKKEITLQSLELVKQTRDGLWFGVEPTEKTRKLFAYRETDSKNWLDQFAYNQILVPLGKMKMHESAILTMHLDYPNREPKMIANFLRIDYRTVKKTFKTYSGNLEDGSIQNYFTAKKKVQKVLEPQKPKKTLLSEIVKTTYNVPSCVDVNVDIVLKWSEMVGLSESDVLSVFATAKELVNRRRYNVDIDDAWWETLYAIPDHIQKADRIHRRNGKKGSCIALLRELMKGNHK
jgi:hypothetical protein